MRRRLTLGTGHRVPCLAPDHLSQIPLPRRVWGCRVAPARGTMLDMGPAHDLRPAPARSLETARRHWPPYVTVLLIIATVAQLAAATFASGLPQFEGKA